MSPDGSIPPFETKTSRPAKLDVNRDRKEMFYQKMNLLFFIDFPSK